MFSRHLDSYAMPSAERCALIAIILASAGSGVRSDVQSGVRSDVQSGVQSGVLPDVLPGVQPDVLPGVLPAGSATVNHENAVRSYGQLCTSVDSPAACLFKGLLKGALMYATRKHNAAAADKVGEDATGGAGGGIVQQPKGIEEYLLEQLQNIIGIFSFGLDLPAEVTAPWTLLKSSFLNGRGKKNKNLGPMLAAGVAVMLGTLVPLAFGALFMLAGKAILTSLLAITISGLLGLKSLFGGKHEAGHYKAYSAPPPAHYSEAQFEQELGVFKGQTEAKMHSSSGNYYAGDSNLAAYYKGAEQQSNGSDPPEYYAVGANAVSPKFTGIGGGHRHGGELVDNNIGANVNANNNNNNNAANNNNNSNKIIAERIG